MPDVSVIIPIKGIEIDPKIIYSVLNQNYGDFEIILCVSNLFNMILPDDQRIKVFKFNENKEPSVLNKAIYLAKGNFICFLHTNELLLFDGIKTRLDAVKNSRNAKICLGLGINADEQYLPEKDFLYEFFADRENSFCDDISSFIVNLPLFSSLSSLLIKKEALLELNFNENYDYMYGWDFFIRLFLKFQNGILTVKDPICLSNREKALIRENKKKFIAKFIKESASVIASVDNKALIKGFDTVFANKPFLLASLLIKEFFPSDIRLKVLNLCYYLKLTGNLNDQMFSFTCFKFLLNDIIVHNTGI
jgi:glycosyltransferase involved in cell wall biosynthesis